jgi:hypothetical protein
MKFGNYAIVSEIKHEFTKEPDWWWIIKPPTGRDELEVSKLLSTDRTRMDEEGNRVSVMPTTLEIAIREISVTFGGTNIPTSESDPTPMLKKDASLAEVEQAVKEMPREMIFELWNAVGDAVPGWGPAKPKARKTDGAAKN